MGYIFTPKFDIMQQWKIQSTIARGIRAELSSAKIISNLATAGLTYRRINMLHDIRRGRAIEFSKNPVSKLRAETFFDSVYEPFRADKKVTSDVATDLWRKVRDKTEELLELDKEEEEFWNKYKLSFM